jgi:hypothetical protein
MDGPGIPACRRVVELRHFGRRFQPGNDHPFPVMARDVQLGYDGLDAHIASYDSGVDAN